MRWQVAIMLLVSGGSALGQVPKLSGLPVTNSIPLTTVIVQQVDTSKRHGQGIEFDIRQIAAEGASKPNWTWWSLVITNAQGKRIRTDTERYSRKVLREELGESLYWGCTLHGTEYVAGDHLHLLEPGESRVLTVQRRATDYGVEKLIMFGPGAYVIRNGEIETISGKEERPPLEITDTRVLIQSEVVSVLMVYNPAATGTILRTRLRERSRWGAGRAFEGVPRESIEIRHSGKAFQLNRFATRDGEILTTNLVEVEIKARLPEIHFKVERAPYSF